MITLLLRQMQVLWFIPCSDGQFPHPMVSYPRRTPHTFRWRLTQMYSESGEAPQAPKIKQCPWPQHARRRTPIANSVTSASRCQNLLAAHRVMGERGIDCIQASNILRHELTKTATRKSFTKTVQNTKTMKQIHTFSFSLYLTAWTNWTIKSLFTVKRIHKKTDKRKHSCIVNNYSFGIEILRILAFPFLVAYQILTKNDPLVM